MLQAFQPESVGLQPFGKTMQELARVPDQDDALCLIQKMLFKSTIALQDNPKNICWQIW
jgi:hypothetical protein